MEISSQTPLLVRLAMTLLLATNQLATAYDLDPDSRGRMRSAQLSSAILHIGTITDGDFYRVYNVDIQTNGGGFGIIL
jgi:hypothetical protein